jgi:hypothetical protein
MFNNFFVRDALKDLKKNDKNFISKFDEISKEYNLWKQYNNSTYNESIAASQNKKIKQETQAKLRLLRKTHQDAAKMLVDRIQKEVDRWVTSPSDGDILQRLGAVQSSGIKLSRLELETLSRQCADQYLPMRILVDIADKSGYSIGGLTIDDIAQDLKELSEYSLILERGYSGTDNKGMDLQDLGTEKQGMSSQEILASYTGGPVNNPPNTQGIYASAQAESIAKGEYIDDIANKWEKTEPTIIIKNGEPKELNEGEETKEDIK